MANNAPETVESSCTDFLLARLQFEYQQFSEQRQIVDRTTSFYLTAIAVLMTVSAVLVRGFWDNPPIDPTAGMISLALILIVSVGFGTVTFLRLCAQRKGIVGIEKRTRVLESYFVSQCWSIAPFLLEHQGGRLKQDYVAHAYFGGVALLSLRAFAVWNALLFGFSCGLTSYVVGLAGLGSAHTTLWLALAVGTISFGGLLIWYLRGLAEYRSGAEEVFRAEYELALNESEGSAKHG